MAGLVVILLGAEMLLRGASRIAVMLGIRPIVIGLTVVTVGTTMPELAVGVTSALEGKGSLAVGNIAGTNIMNILFILGLSALIRPLPMRLLSIQLDVPVMIASSLALIAMAWDGVLSRTEGSLLLLGAAAYTVAMVPLNRRETRALKREFAEEYNAAALGTRRSAPHATWNTLLLLVGIALTVLGARLLVSSAVNIAQAWGVSDAIIGLTIVAIGTSAPELATTVMATLRNDRDVAVGNLIGSCIYNVLVILGITCMVAPDGVAIGRDILLIDLPLAAAAAVLCWPVFRTDRLVSRLEGGSFVCAYLAYLGWLVFVRS
ncbi:MAG: calcium/sodium antiporter [Cytophagales bacterium]|nr:calcium/sodium antiporter [Rhizobacter sp.]